MYLYAQIYKDFVLFKWIKKNLGFSSSKEETEKKDTDKTLLSVDRLFVENFKQNGGFFFYSLQDDWENFLLQIMIKHSELNSILCYDAKIKSRIEKIIPEFLTQTPNENTIFVTTCEFLIAENGSIFFTYNQLKNKKIHEYPNTILVIAKVSQIIQEPSNGMSIVNERKGKIRENITFVREFKENKKMFLFLQEDLI